MSDHPLLDEQKRQLAAMDRRLASEASGYGRDYYRARLAAARRNVRQAPSKSTSTPGPGKANQAAAHEGTYKLVVRGQLPDGTPRECTISGPDRAAVEAHAVVIRRRWGAEAISRRNIVERR